MSSRLTTPRSWTIVGIFGALIVLLLGWFLLVSPQQSKASSTSMEAAEVQGTAEGLQVKANNLKKQAVDLPQKQQELAALSQRLPDNAGVAEIIRQITAAAARSGVTLQEFTPSDPQPLEPPAKSSGSGADSGAATAEPSPSNNDGGGAAPKTSAAPASGLRYVTLTIAAAGNPAQISSFIKELESITRALLMTDLEVSQANGSQANVSDGGLNVTVDGRIFMRPEEKAADSASPSATPSPSGS